MKVAQVIGTYEYGGIGNIITNITKYLNKKGIYTEIVCIRKKFQPKNIKVVSFESKLKPAILFGSLKMVNYLKKFDIVHIHGSLPIIFTLFKTKKNKIVYSHHGWHIGVKDTELKTYLGSIFFLKLYQLLSSKVDAFIGISKWSQKEIKIFFNRRSFLLKNPVDEKKFKPTRKLIKKIGNPMILSVGRNRPHKGHKYEIFAMKSVIKFFPHAKLVIVGEDYQSLIPIVRQQKLNNYVVFLGKVNDNELPRLYNSCDVYITASLWELFGLTLLEALFCGKPIIARNAFAMSELVKESKAGILFNSNEEISNAIIKAIRKKKILEKNAIKFRKKYIKENNWERYIRSLILIYKKLLGK